MSVFDLEQFASAGIDSDLSTKPTPFPTGEYVLQIQGPFGDEKATRIRQTDKGQVILDVVYMADGNQQTPDGDMLSDVIGIATPTVRQSIFLDINESGHLDDRHGKNFRLGQLREALGQNTKGKTWNFQMLIGGMVLGKVTHRIVGEDVYADVKSVSKA
jgi:hypothetical protein